MNGLMMDYPLTLTHLLDRAPRFFGYREVVSKLPEGVHRYTYNDFHERVGRLMGALAELGVEPGDRVATFAFNSFRHLELYFAIPCGGAVLHTLNIRLFDDQLTYVVNHARDGVIFVDRALVPRLEALAHTFEPVRAYVVMGGVPEDTSLSPVYDYEELVESSPSVPAASLGERTAAALCYTSGTTGDPKGVLYDHRSLVLHSFASCASDSLGVSEGDSILVVVPQFHANAWGLPFTAVMAGAKQVYPGPFMQPEHLAAMIESERITIPAGVPTLWIGLFHYLKAHPHDTSSVTRMLVGGSAMPKSLIDAYDKELGIPVLHAWGMTEMTPLGTVAMLKSNAADLSEDERLTLRAKQGMPPAGVDMRIVDEDGEPLSWDGASVGEVQVRGPWVARAYFQGVTDGQAVEGEAGNASRAASPGATEPDSAGVSLKPSEAGPFTPDGWFRTGDVATLDEHGFMQITDRTKDLIKSGGEWISSVELENAIMAHPAVKECAVIAVPSDRWLERPLAAAVPVDGEDGPSLDALRTFLEGKVAKWWMPDAVTWLEALPKTSVGKFDKKTLRRMVEEGDIQLPAAPS